MTIILFVGIFIIIVLLLLSNQIDNFGRLNLEIERSIKEDMVENIINTIDSIDFLKGFLSEAKQTSKEDLEKVNDLIDKAKEIEDIFNPKEKTMIAYEVAKELTTTSSELLKKYSNDNLEEKGLSIKKYIENSVDKFARDIQDLNNTIDKRNKYIDNSFISKVNFLLKIEKEEKFKL